MPYTLIADFRLGVDRSRPIYAGISGSLWSGINGHVTRGGDFEKRKAFQATYALPTGTFGCAAAGSALYVFGSGADPGVPSGVTYQRLQHPDGITGMSAVLWTERYNGLLYVIAEFTDSSIHHYYNGTIVSDWEGGAGNPSFDGVVAKTLSRKIYSAGSNKLAISGNDTATGWTDGTDTGADEINMSNHLGGAETLTALSVYQKKLAVFSRLAIQIWDMAADPTANSQVQVIEGTGTRAAGSALGFGDLDVFYLSDSGVRSLRARDITNIAGVNDVGTPIDTLIREWVDTLDDTTVADAVAVVEPVDGRYWLAIGDRIFVFTYFPTKKVSAWSWYEPGFTVEQFTVVTDRLYCRSGDVIYLYGGPENATYDLCTVTIQLPFLTAGKPGHNKQVTGLDIAATGTWDCKLLTDPNDEDRYTDIGELSGVTFQDDDAAGMNHGTHVAPLLVHEDTGYASVSQIALYYQGADSEGGT